MTDINFSEISQQVQADIQIKQFRDFLGQYNKLSEDCFSACIWDFTSRSIKNQEDACVKNCVEKYTKVTQRISERFQELQMLTNENTIAMAQKMGKLSPS